MAIACLVWMFRHIVKNTDRKVEILGTKQDEMIIKQSEHSERLAVVEADAKARHDEIRQFRKDVHRRFTEVDKRFDKVDERFTRIDERFDKVDERFDKVDERFTEVDKRFTRIDERFDRVDEKMEAGFARADAKMDKGFKEMRELFFRFLAPNQPKPQQNSNLALLGRQSDEALEPDPAKAFDPSASLEQSALPASYPTPPDKSSSNPSEESVETK